VGDRVVLCKKAFLIFEFEDSFERPSVSCVGSENGSIVITDYFWLLFIAPKKSSRYFRQKSPIFKVSSLPTTVRAQEKKQQQ
jgi:hypothetical protein